MKKNYQQPAICIVRLASHGHMLQSSVQQLRTNLTGDDEIHVGGAANVDARVKANTVDWDDWGE